MQVLGPEEPTRCSAATDELHVLARHIKPGDHLPPQRALHGTRYRHDGFTVGTDDRDVLGDLAVLPGRMLLFGPSGSLDSVAVDDWVAVRRTGRTQRLSDREAG